jgi:opacity protein-like surface antigen
MKKTMMFLTFILVFGTLILVFGINSATAQTTRTADVDRAPIKNTFGIGPRLGYYKASDADEGSYYGGIQARLRLGAIIGIEAAVDYGSGQEYGVGEYTVKTSFIPVTASIMLFVPITESLRPYGFAGLGAYYTLFTFSDAALDLGFEDDSNFNLGYHLGFGAELPLSSNIALTADYRYLFLNPSENEESINDADFNGNIFTAGLMFYF